MPQQQSQPVRISFVARTIPVAKARHKSFAFRGRAGKLMTREYIDDCAAKSESEFMALAAPHAPTAPLEGALEIELTFIMPIPKTVLTKHERVLAERGLLHHTKKPDVDNLVKLVLDCLTRSGRWWRDDVQVARIRAEKIYGAAPETRVTVAAINPQAALQSALV